MNITAHVIRQDFREQSLRIGLLSACFLCLGLIDRDLVNNASYLFVFIAACSFGAPILLVSNSVTLGGLATPRIHRLFVHTLPISRSRLSVSRLLFGLCSLVLLPLGCLLLGRLVSSATHSVSFSTEYSVEWLRKGLIMSVSVSWLMLAGALLRERLAMLCAPLFIAAELYANHALTATGWGQPFRHGITANLADAGVLLLELLAFGALFVIYHEKRRLIPALLGMLVTLAVFTIVRTALGGWLCS